MALTRLFSGLLDRFEISVQGTLQLTEGQVLDPDFMLLRRRPEGYKQALPSAADLHLLVEVADSSYRKDRHIKAPIYAAAGVPEYWIVDLEREAILIHRCPEGDSYNQVETLKGDAQLSPLAAEDFSLRVGEVFA